MKEVIVRNKNVWILKEEMYENMVYGDLVLKKNDKVEKQIYESKIKMKGV